MRIKVTKAFRDRHGARYARVGIDLSKTYAHEGALLTDMINAHLTDEQCERLARELGWLED